MKLFCDSLTRYSRRTTNPVRIGSVVIGGGNPVAIQTMTNTDTLDTAACVGQIERIAAAGCRIVRLTAQGVREAENLKNIAAELAARGLRGEGAGDLRGGGGSGIASSETGGGGGIALVADVHFIPEVALVAARYVDKVRINPGNYRDPDGELFLELLKVCRTREVALRIGVNHGSLAPRMVERYGDTPEGMVASAMEFLRICQREDFDQVVVSMKSSNVRVMVHAYRLLVAAMDEENMHYPLHLGVTEAGDGLDGRIKSAAGIGALLADGLGDTIRVSLTEEPEREIPVARRLVDYFGPGKRTETAAAIRDTTLYSPYSYRRRPTDVVEYRGSAADRPAEAANRPTGAVCRLGGDNPPLLFSELDAAERQALAVPFSAPEPAQIAIIEAANDNPVAFWRSALLNMEAAGDRRPAILRRRYRAASPEELAIKAAADFAPPFIDGLGDGIDIVCPGIEEQTISDITLTILQAARVRISRTDYIACPGCGRTLFDLQATLAAVRRRTSHLRGLRIGVMGCIVNGPGEMADADFGYVGAGRGLVTLYKGREVVRRAIPEAEALDALVELIKAEGRWMDEQ